MSRKKVVYNGRSDAMYDTSDPSVLVKGKTYEVIGEKVGAWQTNYVLNGVGGCFNSVWFNEA